MDETTTSSAFTYVWRDFLSHQKFWKIRIKHIFGIDLRVNKNDDVTYKEMYKFLKRYGNLSTDIQIVNALQLGYLPILRYIIEDLKYDKQVALNTAASVGNLKLFKYLVDKGAEVFVPDEFDNNALQNAVGSEKLNIVKNIINNFESTSDDLHDAFLGSAGLNNTKILEYFIDVIDEPDLDAALINAAYGSIDSVIVLMNHGADPYANEEEAFRVASEGEQEEILEYMQDNAQ